MKVYPRNWNKHPKNWKLQNWGIFPTFLPRIQWLGQKCNIYPPTHVMGNADLHCSIPQKQEKHWTLLYHWPRIWSDDPRIPMALNFQPWYRLAKLQAYWPPSESRNLVPWMLPITSQRFEKEVGNHPHSGKSRPSWSCCKTNGDCQYS